MLTKQFNNRLQHLTFSTIFQAKNLVLRDQRSREAQGSNS